MDRAPRVNASRRSPHAEGRSKEAAPSASRLRTFAGFALTAAFPLSLALPLGVPLGLLAVAATAAAAAALLALAFREREGRVVSLFMAAMTLPLVGSALTGFPTGVEGGPSSGDATCKEIVNGAWVTVPCDVDFAVLAGALDALLTLQFALPLLFVSLAAYVVRSAFGPVGVRRFAALGLVLSAVVVTNVSQDLGGFVLFLIASPVLVITGLLLFVWALAPLRTQSDAPRVATTSIRETSGIDQKRGRPFIAISAIAASFSLVFSLAAGLSFQGLLDDYPETPMKSFGDLTAWISSGGELSLGEGDSRLVLRNGAVEKLLLIEAEEPCISSGSCNILGVVGIHPNDLSIPVPFLISANQEKVVLEKLTEASAAYFAMEQDPQIGYYVRQTIEQRTADGTYPVVFPTPIRVEGREAAALVRQAHELLARTAYRPDFSLVTFSPFLFIALIPFGALRWAWAAYRGRRSLTLLPGMPISTQSYGVTSGIALLLGAAVSGLIASGTDAAVWAGLTGSSLIAGAGALVATLRSRLD